jgi:inner membrane protein involved in colicin E2 resistance
MLGMTVFMQSLCAWKIVKLDAIARHLNAYSAFRLRLGWRISVAVIMPLAAISLLLWMIMHLESSALIGSGIALVVVLSAVLLAHLPGRNG